MKCLVALLFLMAVAAGEPCAGKISLIWLCIKLNAILQTLADPDAIFLSSQGVYICFCYLHANLYTDCSSKRMC